MKEASNTKTIAIVIGVLLFAQIFFTGNVDSSQATGYAMYTPTSKERAASMNKQIAENNKKIADLEKQYADLISKPPYNYIDPKTGEYSVIGEASYEYGNKMNALYLQIADLKKQNSDLTTQIINILIEDMSKVSVPQRPFRR